MDARSRRNDDLIRAARDHLWHPFTQMRAWMEDEGAPIIERGQGCWLVDTEGNRYLDGVSSLWCNLHGHRVEAIDRAVTEQLGRIAHTTMLGLGSVPAIELASRLVPLLPSGLTRVFSFMGLGLALLGLTWAGRLMNAQWEKGEAEEATSSE